MNKPYEWFTRERAPYPKSEEPEKFSFTVYYDRDDHEDDHDGIDFESAAELHAFVLFLKAMQPHPTGTDVYEAMHRYEWPNDPDKTFWATYGGERDPGHFSLSSRCTYDYADFDLRTVDDLHEFATFLLSRDPKSHPSHDRSGE